jgi:predicted branched-subunit amino acid permease
VLSLNRLPLTAEFRAGAGAGFRAFLPQSIGLIPWGMVTGVAMVGSGLTPVQAMGMNVIVFSGTAQLGTLPLIAAGAPLWLIVATALALNLRFVIFSAGIAGNFQHLRTPARWGIGYLLVDGVFAICLEPMLRNENPQWRLGHYLAPSLWAWALWQVSGLIGILFADAAPQTWSLEFMATIALLVLLLPMAGTRPMLVAALTGGAVAIALHGLPLRFGLLTGMVAGILAGFAAERWQPAAVEG